MHREGKPSKSDSYYFFVDKNVYCIGQKKIALMLTQIYVPDFPVSITGSPAVVLIPVESFTKLARHLTAS